MSECFGAEVFSNTKMEFFAKNVRSFRALTIFVKSSILDIQLRSEDVSADNKPLVTFSKNKAADLFPN